MPGIRSSQWTNELGSTSVKLELPIINTEYFPEGCLIVFHSMAWSGVLNNKKNVYTPLLHERHANVKILIKYNMISGHT